MVNVILITLGGVLISALIIYFIVIIIREIKNSYNIIVQFGGIVAVTILIMIVATILLALCDAWEII